jgi:hypothetical protein
MRSAPKDADMLADLRAYGLVAGITLVVFLVGVLHLEAHGLWYDEAYSLSFATASWSDFLSGLHRIDGPIAGYYALLHLWLSVVPVSVESSRFPSLVFGVATLPAIYLLAREFSSRKGGLVAVIFLACNMSWWSQAEDARVYALAVLLLTLGYLFFARVLFREPSSRNAIWAGVLTGLTFVFQAILGGTALLAQIASLVCWPASGRTRIFAALAIGIAGLMSVATLGFMAIAHFGSTDAAWLNVRIPFKYVLGDISSAFGMRRAFAPGIVALAVALFFGWRERGFWTLVLWTAVPILTMLSTELFHPLFIDRYLLAAFPPFIVLLAIGTVRVPNQTAAIVLGLLIVAGESYETIKVDREPTESWDVAVHLLQTATHPGDVAYITPREAEVPLNTELALEHTTLPPSLVVYPGGGAKQWSSNVYDTPPMPAALRKGTVWLLFWGFIDYFKPTPDFVAVMKTHHECGRWLAGGRPILIKYCAN